MPIARNLLARQREGAAGFQLDRLRVDRAEPHLRARQVGHDGDTPANGFRRLAYADNALGMSCKIAVRKVQSRDVESGANQALEHLGRVRRRPNGSHDPGLVVCDRHHE